MTERDALYQAVCELADEDAPRLAFADFLDEEETEEGRLYARFIRVQIGMTRLEEQRPQWRNCSTRSGGC